MKMAKALDTDIASIEMCQTDFLKDIEEAESTFPNLEDYFDSLQQMENFNKNCGIKEKLKAFQEQVQEERFKKAALEKKIKKSSNFDEEHESLENIRKKQKSLDEEAEILKRKVQLKEEELMKLKARVSELQDDQEKDVDTKLKQELDLYRSFFPVKFDMSAPDGILKGFVLQEPNSAVVPFSINTETKSQFFTTNYLWKQLGDPKQFKNDA